MIVINIVIQPFHDYKKWNEEGFRTRDAHLFEFFKNNPNVKKILIINRPVSLAENVLKRRDWVTDFTEGRVFYKGSKYNIHQIEEKTFVLDIFSNDFLKVIYERKKWWYSTFNDPDTLKIIKDSLQLLNINDYTFLLQNPMAIGLFKLSPANIVFDTIDDWTSHPQMKSIKKLTKRNYQVIDRYADIITSVSKNNFALFDNNQNVFEIPNGVDMDFFKPLPSNSGKITFGYVGKIQSRFDFDLLIKCAMKFPNAAFQIYGPILDFSSRRKAKLVEATCDNVRFLGEVDYGILPNIINSFDVCLILHKNNRFTKSMSPLKLFEYIACGKQVVSTAISGIDDISDYVYIAETDSDFINHCQQSIKVIRRTNNVSSLVRKSIKEDITWDNRGRRLLKLIEEYEN